VKAYFTDLTFLGGQIQCQHSYGRDRTVQILADICISPLQ